VRRARSGLASVVVAVTLTSAPSMAMAMGSVEDPLEAANRIVFALNERFRPAFTTVINTVNDVVDPGFAQALRNLSNNLAEPGTALGHFAEGDLSEARLALKRFLINGIEGPLGLRDIAAAEGLPPRPAPVRDVLCRLDVPAGPYLVLPFFGGMSLRGAVAQTATIGAAFAILGEYYVGWRIMTYLLAGPTRPHFSYEAQFLVNGHPDLYAAARTRQQAIEQASCAAGSDGQEAEPSQSDASGAAAPSLANGRTPVVVSARLEH
jgi:ABC-type transporter lipoprotein component MlaA